MINFNGRLGHIDVPLFSGSDSAESGRKNSVQIGADDSIFNFSKSSNASLNVQNSKQDFNSNNFAKQFASRNGFSVEEAEFVLEKMYGITDSQNFDIWG